MIDQILSSDNNSCVITIRNQNPEQVYEFFRDFKNLALFMKGVVSVREVTTKHSHWIVKLKSGAKASWYAEITNEVPGIMIALESLPQSEVVVKGSIWFAKAPHDEGTVVSLSMDYDVLDKSMRNRASTYVSDNSERLALSNLLRLKSYFEADEAVGSIGHASLN